MSLVRMGLSENKKFGDNYDAIFGKKKAKPAAKKTAKNTARSKAKKKLCCESAGKMTLELLLERDPGREILGLMQRIAQIVGAG